MDARTLRRAAQLQAQARRGANGNGRAIRPVFRLAPMVATTLGPEELEGLGLIPAVALPAVKSLVSGALVKSIPLVGGIFKRDKDPGRLATNAEAYNLAISGNVSAYKGYPSPLEFLRAHTVPGAWGTEKARADAAAKYQQAQQVLAGNAPRVPVSVPVNAPESFGSQVAPAVQGILQTGAQQLLQNAGFIPSAAPGPTYTPGYAQELPGFQPAPAGPGDVPPGSKNNLGLLLGVAGIGLAFALRGGGGSSRRRR